MSDTDSKPDVTWETVLPYAFLLVTHQKSCLDFKLTWALKYLQAFFTAVVMFYVHYWCTIQLCVYILRVDVYMCIKLNIS